MCRVKPLVPGFTRIRACLRQSQGEPNSSKAHGHWLYQTSSIGGFSVFKIPVRLGDYPLGITGKE